MLARAFFYPTLAYGMMMTKVSGRNWYNRVDETVIIGALPLKRIAKKLIEEEKIKAVLSVNEDYELKRLTFTKTEWAERGVEQLRINAVDLTGTLSERDLVHGVDFITRQSLHGNTVYVHCKAGRTRSAMVVICYLMKAHRLTPEKSHDVLKSFRSQIWLRDKQWRSIYHFYYKMKKPPDTDVK